MTFSDYLRVLRRFAALVGAMAIVGMLIALAFAAIPSTKYRTRFAVTLAPHTDDAGTYGNLIDSLDRRSIPSTFAQVVASPSVQSAAASSARVSRAGIDVAAGVAGESNVIEATITGTNRDAVRSYAGALLDRTSETFAKLYPLYSVTPLREPAPSTAVPRHLFSAALLGAAAGALSAYLIAIGLDAGRRRASRARIDHTPFAQPRFGGASSAARPRRRRHENRLVSE
jgi:hypothetical protein